MCHAQGGASLPAAGRGHHPCWKDDGSDLQGPKTTCPGQEEAAARGPKTRVPKAGEEGSPTGHSAPREPLPPAGTGLGGTWLEVRGPWGLPALSVADRQTLVFSRGSPVPCMFLQIPARSQPLAPCCRRRVLDVWRAPPPPCSAPSLHLQAPSLPVGGSLPSAGHIRPVCAEHRAGVWGDGWPGRERG